MKQVLLALCVIMVAVGCSKNPETFGPAQAYAPVAVTKTNTKRVFAHVVPWFESKATNGGTVWGAHWTMNYTDPDLFTNSADTQRQIASYYYPMIGPYASGDTNVIDYQLLLMKLSGIDGIFIDWYGVSTNAGAADYSKIRANTLTLISRIGKVGLKYSIVYEDQALGNYDSANTIIRGKADMNYMKTNFFQDPNYETVAGHPLLLNFGPQHIFTASMWDSVFSVLPTSPSFYILWYGTSNVATYAASGEFTWISQNDIPQLNSFYSSYSGSKIASAYPGFNSYYAAAHVTPNPTPWTLPYTYGSETKFQATLDLGLSQSVNYLQLATWNDYGEGTMIEPTKEFQYSYLTALQTTLGVSSLSLSDLQAVATLYQLRINNAGNVNELNKLNQAYYYMVSLQMAKAKSLLN
jgi:hypothetical protein